MNQNVSANPYATPVSDVHETHSGEYGAVKILSVSGRLGRVRYLAYVTALVMIAWLGGSLLMGVLAAATAGLGRGASMSVAMISVALIYGAMIIGSWMLAIQRLHDFDTSGWMTLLFLVPLVNVIFGFALLFVPGTDGENRFGKKTPQNSTGVKIMAVLAPVSFIVFIGILAAIAIPQYQHYKLKAQQAAHSRP